MAGCVYVVTGPTSFYVGFAISEIIAQVSKITKEGLLMIKKALEMRSRSFVKSFKTLATAFWEAHLPSRHSLLMSSCNPSEKETGKPPNYSVRSFPSTSSDGCSGI
jgi:hypothetical protein